MGIKTTLTLRVRTPEGKIVREIEQPMRSFLRHFFDLMYQCMGAGTLTINDIGGVARTNQVIGASPLSALCVGAPAGQVGTIFYNRYNATTVATETYNGSQWGLVVGTDNTAPAPLNDALVAKIAHGEAAGELLYGGTEFYALTVANPNGSFKIRRYFTNASGGNVTVQEVGLYSPALNNTTGNVYLFCIARDVIPAGGVLVADTEILEVTYTPAIVV